MPSAEKNVGTRPDAQPEVPLFSIVQPSLVPPDLESRRRFLALLGPENAAMSSEELADMCEQMVRDFRARRTPEQAQAP